MENTHSLRSALQRRDAIARLVREGPVRSQEDLQRRLRRRGITVAQPTLSRDLRRLGLVKAPSGYIAPGPAATPIAGPRDDESLDRTLHAFALAVRPAGSLVVVRTPPAGAQPVARALDEADLPAVAGTVAGDDTVFVATAGPAAAKRLARRLSRALEGRRPAPRPARA
jgi:transcriptional regulator of arginine metabolism